MSGWIDSRDAATVRSILVKMSDLRLREALVALANGDMAFWDDLMEPYGRHRVAQTVSSIANEILMERERVFR